MKKLIAVLVILAVAFFAFAADVINATVTSSASGNLFRSAPNDVVVINLQDNTVNGTDSIGADSANYYGPVQIASANGPMFKGFQIWVEDGINSADSVQIAYQLIPTNSINDTLATWTALDTVAAAAEITPYTDLSSLIGAAAVIRILSLSASSTELPDQIYFMGKKTETYNED